MASFDERREDSQTKPSRVKIPEASQDDERDEEDDDGGSEEADEEESRRSNPLVNLSRKQ